MSTLTRTLIILLTLSSIFLCGIVVTYIANADDYRQKAEDAAEQLNAENQKSKYAETQLKQAKQRFEREQDTQGRKVAAVQTKLKQASLELENTKREKAELLKKVNNWVSITRDFYETNDKQGQMLKNTLARLDDVQAKQIKQEKELAEKTIAIVEKIKIIDTLETDNRRLLEEKSRLQRQLDKLLSPFGEKAVALPPEPAAEATEQLGLAGRITQVDLKNSMASISIGAADGVAEGMTFHVTRGDKFVCDILIIDVEPENAVGVLELVQTQPKTGDNVATNL